MYRFLFMLGVGTEVDRFVMHRSIRGLAPPWVRGRQRVG